MSFKSLVSGGLKLLTGINLDRPDHSRNPAKTGQSISHLLYPPAELEPVLNSAPVLPLNRVALPSGIQLALFRDIWFLNDAEIRAIVDKGIKFRRDFRVDGNNAQSHMLFALPPSRLLNDSLARLMANYRLRQNAMRQLVVIDAQEFLNRNLGVTSFSDVLPRARSERGHDIMMNAKANVLRSMRRDPREPLNTITGNAVVMNSLRMFFDATANDDVPLFPVLEVHPLVYESTLPLEAAEALFVSHKDLFLQSGRLREHFANTFYYRGPQPQALEGVVYNSSQFVTRRLDD